MHSFEIIVQFGTNTVELGYCDADHISIITLLHCMSKKTTGKEDVPKEQFCVFVILPWCNDVVEVKNDNELVNIFSMFREHGCSRIVFEIDYQTYVPLPPEGSSFTPNAVDPEVFIDEYEGLDVDDLDENYFTYHGDDEDGGSVNGEEGGIAHNGNANSQVVVGFDDDNDQENHILWEGYQSREDDEFLSDSEMENVEGKIAKLMNGNPFNQIVGGDIRFAVGQTHDSVYTLRELLRDYAIQEGVNLHRVKNEKNRLTYKCKGEGCSWRIYASCMIDGVTMKIKTYNDLHECHRVHKNDEAKVSWIARKFETLVKSNPDIKIGVIADLLRDKYKVNVDIGRLYKAKRRALDGLGKDHSECFKHLRGYAFMVQQSNPGSVAYIRMQQPEPTFQRFFLSFHAQKHGFLGGCRPFIGLDGCHLKGPLGGVLLAAVALDANNGVYPLAVCICEAENLLSWSWFLKHLHDYLKYPTEKPLCFMSDRQKGVLSALEMQFPFATTRFCARHIYANFRLKHSGQKLKTLFWMCSRSSNLFEFNDAMAEIGRVNIDARTWLDKINLIHWSRHAFDQSIKCDHVTNNMTESFNSMLGDHRAKTFLQLLEFIRRMVMKRFQKRKEECLGWKIEIPPSVSKKILMASKNSRILRMLSAGNGEYELLDERRAYVVKINQATCECGGWQVSGIPCCHAMTAISHYAGRDGVTRRIVEYVHPKLTKTAFSHTYSTMIHPIPDICVWPNLNTTPLIPPPFRTKPGRPKFRRRREPGEKPKEGRSRSVACNKCGQPGHNKRTCRNEPVFGRKKQRIRETDAAGASTSQLQSEPPTQTQPQSQVTQH